MTRLPGVSAGEFTDRINNVASIIDEWPFSKISSDTFYADRFRATPINSYTSEGQKYAAVEPRCVYEATLDRPAIVALEQAQYPLPDLEIDIADDAVEAWRQMIGVRLLASIALRPFKVLTTRSHNSRSGALDHILGIEQPMRVQRSPAYGRHNTGYIQGEVTSVSGADISPHNYYIRVRLGRETMLSHVRTQLLQTRHVHRPQDQSRPVLQEGDVIRTRVERAQSPNHLFMGAGLAHVLNTFQS